MHHFLVPFMASNLDPVLVSKIGRKWSHKGTPNINKIVFGGSGGVPWVLEVVKKRVRKMTPKMDPYKIYFGRLLDQDAGWPGRVCGPCLALEIRNPRFLVLHACSPDGGGGFRRSAHSARPGSKGKLQIDV